MDDIQLEFSVSDKLGKLYQDAKTFSDRATEVTHHFSRTVQAGGRRPTLGDDRFWPFSTYSRVPALLGRSHNLTACDG